MRAVKLFEPGDIRLVELEKPVPGPGEVLLQVKEVGICASDIHWYEDGGIGDTRMTEPLILGHEFAGIIAEVGPGVTNVKPGDRVAVEPGIHCGHCDMCLAGEINICRNILFCGTAPTDGALRDFMTWPARLIEHIPDSISMGEAAMLEPIAVGVYAVEIAGRTLNPHPQGRWGESDSGLPLTIDHRPLTISPIQGEGSLGGMTIGIIGSGAIGLSILQAAKAAGCGEAYVSDLYPFRLDIARRLGADHTLNASETDVAAAIKEAAGGMGLNIVFEAAGVNDAVVTACEIVRPGGTVVLGGIPSDDRVLLKAGTVRRKALTIRFLRRSKNTLRKSIKLVSEGKVDAASYVTHRFPLEQTKEALETARASRNTGIRVIVQLS